MNLKSASKARYFTKATAVKDTSPAKEKQSNTSVHADASCPICQEPVGQRTPEGKIESWSKLPCGHKFGSHCIKHWLGLVAEDRPCCPMCRQNASHLCGHPVLPELITHNRKTTSDMEKPAGRADMLQYTNCVFCSQDIVARPRKKRLKPWRLVKGCWRLVRHGRIRERPAPVPQVTMFAYFPRLRDAEWERWWSNQEPRNA
ncbi:hypothetical protein CONLIGDRAFT_366200 [Coniochaeta ligniaria NRRL 30616]|uniref:RING-type domain-containing protein n=1 Tax=Coniochaeta ligniaria NRRL 30616 TaxID=1408157 RepID=A0A1J7IRU1_9PEZI|nr:hypothetical protein CONLIGDRAFT_366200 [Coniochaeta ligniaria NRRL 30616]